MAFAADSNNQAIRFVSSAGIMTTVAGAVSFGQILQTAQNTGAGGPISNARLFNPLAVLNDGSRGVLVAGELLECDQ